MGRRAMNSAAMAVLRGRKVLVVDDIATNRLLLQFMLRAEGMVVELACDGLEAVRRVESEAFDLVLMDLSMPVMDGYQATRAILDSTSRASDGARPALAALPIIAVTANQAPAHLRHQALQIRFKSTTWNQKSARMALHLCSAAQRTSNLAA